MDQSIYNSDPAFPGWRWTINDLTIKACNITEPHKICSIILHALNKEDIDHTIGRVKEAIKKHEKEIDIDLFPFIRNR